MSRTTPRTQSKTQVLKSTATAALLALATGLAGCMQTALAQDGAAPAAAASANAAQAKPILNTASCSRPAWPKDALARRSQGTTTVNFLIDTDGSVAESKVTKSSGDPSLDEAARAAIAKCTFRPAAGSDKKPARAWVPVQYVWTLDAKG